MASALLRAALVAYCLRGAFPPVDLRAVCFVRAISKFYNRDSLTVPGFNFRDFAFLIHLGNRRYHHPMNHSVRIPGSHVFGEVLVVRRTKLPLKIMGNL